MKNRFYFLCFFCLTVSLPLQAQSTADVEPDGPKLELSAPAVDFGTIDQFSDPFRTIIVKNVGNAPLLIKSANTSCGCTVPSYDKSPILPGEETELRIRYDTKRVGPINKKVTLLTNEGEYVKHVIKVIGMVHRKKTKEKPAPTNLTPASGKSQ